MQEVIGRSLPDGAFDFVVPDLERDIAKHLYLTVKLAKESDDPTVRKMYARMAEHFCKVDDLITAGDLRSLATARRMLRCPEASEFRLGFTVNGSAGNGIGEGVLRDVVFTTLVANPWLRRELRIEPDALSSIRWIAEDRTSDFIATICKDILIEYTQQQAAFWGFSAACLQVRQVKNCFLTGADRLGSIEARVPVDDLGRIFLLIPKEICRSGPAFSAYQYFRDVPPDADVVGPTQGMTAKERMLQDAAAHPERFAAFVKDRMRDSTRFKARKEYRK